MTKPFTTRRQFVIRFDGLPVLIEAQIAFCNYTIMNATADGASYEFSDDDMEAFEQFVESWIETTPTQALNLETYRTEVFTVTSIGGDILAIETADGYHVPRSSPTFTEAAEAWHIDREYTEAVESDQPRLAAIAGYLRPVPTQQGHGYRRAA